jgi:hypothetical protein
MPITPEERARIARENGAKSKGPVTPEGKDRSRLNSLKDGKYAQALAHLVPTDEAVSALEDRREYAILLNELIAEYRPVNNLAFRVVVDIATHTWHIRRYRHVITAHWNLTTFQEAAKVNDLPEELFQLTLLTSTAAALHTGNKMVSVYNREITRLETAVARLERRLKLIHASFATPSAPAPEERTQPETESPIENKELSTEEPEAQPAEPEPVILVDPAPDAVETARRDHPGSPIVILPAVPDTASTQ